MVTLHSRKNGAFLTTLQVLTDRSWVVNNKGKCLIYMSAKDEKLIRIFIGERHYIRITHPTLPDWGGVIETERSVSL